MRLKRRIRPYSAGLFVLVLSTPLFSQQLPLDRQALLTAALKNNNEYLQAESRNRQAAEEARTARAALLPDVKFSTQLSWLTTPQTYTIKAGDFYSGNLGAGPFLLPAEDYTVEFSKNSNYDFSLTLEQPLFTWGKIRNSITAADLGKEASGIGLQKQRRETETRLDILLVTLDRLKKMKPLLQEQKFSAMRLNLLSEENFNKGFLLQSDLISARLLAREAELAEYRMEEQRSQALLSLQTLTGLGFPDSDLVKTEGADPAGNDRPEDREALLARGLAASLDMKLLELRTRAAEKQLEIARGGSYGKPDLGLYLQFSYSGSAFPLAETDWMNIDTGNIISTLGIHTTLFDGGEIRGGIRKLEEELVWIRLDQKKGTEALSEYIRTSLFKIELSRRNLDYIDLQIEAGLARKTQKENAWKAGYGDEKDVLTEELNWYTRRLNRIQEELNLSILQLQLENALGPAD